MMDHRPLGVILVVIGAVVAVVAALANPLGLGEEDVFGWLQITGVVVGVIVALIGLALTMDWVRYPARTAQTTTAPTTTTTTTTEKTVTED
jgi:uncharacterized membrane protein